MQAAWKTESVVARYLSGVRSALPLLESHLDLMHHLIRSAPRPPATVLDLGCGDGFLGGLIKSIYPSAQVVFCDYSEPMLGNAKSKLSGIADCHFINGDFSSPSLWDSLAPYTPFDLVVSGFAIHHQPDAGKRAIYNRIFQCLSPSGLFLNLEHVASTAPHYENLFEESIIQRLIQAESTKDTPRSPESIRKDFKDREDKKENKLTLMETQCEWLRAIGFEKVDCYAKYLEIALFGGHKPSN